MSTKWRRKGDKPSIDLSHLRSEKYSRRHFMVKTAKTMAGAALATTGAMAGFAWGDLAYAQQLKGKPVKFNVAIRPDWTQGWFGMINEELGIWKKYLPEGSEVTFSHPIQGGIVTNELIAGKSMIGHNGDAPGLIATYKRDRVDIRAIGLIGSSPSGYHCYQVMVRTDAPKFNDSKEALKWMDGKVVACPKGSCSDRFFQDVLKREGIKPKEYLNQPIVDLLTTEEGVRVFRQVTGNYIDERLAIVLDGSVYSAPTIQSKIMNGRSIITGSGDEAEAKDLLQGRGALWVHDLNELPEWAGQALLDAGLLGI